MLIKLKTQSKLKIARILSETIIFFRKHSGRSEKGIFSRNGITWEIDLREGIDLSIFLFGCFEREVSHCYSKILKPGMQVIDIGANIGAHTLPMAKLIKPDGQVHAFEPTLFAIKKLRRNLTLNSGLEEIVTVHHAFLNHRMGAPVPEEIPSSWNLSSDSRSTHPQHGGAPKTVGEAESLSLDDFIAKNPNLKVDLIKLDVDGNELDVLKGALQCLNHHSPVLLMELAPDYDSIRFREMLILLKELRYTASSLKSRAEIPLEETKLRSLIPKNGSINVVLKKIGNETLNSL